MELGQLTVIAIRFLLVGTCFGNKSWHRQILVIPRAAIIALIGDVWFIQRTNGHWV